mmetsp:Transcript_24934/g.76907  ORF Transcript_24934/g.76907 Transcript_24934/m.76907 type:complete len:207 (+) Transcript_24934:391-1011(+)
MQQPMASASLRAGDGPGADVVSEILDFWFDGPGSGKHYWAGGREEQTQLDELIRARFGEQVAKAADGAYTEWEETPSGSLALIILLDQWSRNVYRGTPKAFSQDERAQQVCLNGVAKGFHLELSDEPSDATGSSRRQMFLIPLFHAENIELLEKALSMLPVARYAWGIEGYTRQRILEMQTFGRIPSRNAAKGLVTTPEERAMGAA